MTATHQPETIPLSAIKFRAAFLDPAGGKQQVKKTRAKSAIIVVGADSLNRFFVLYTWAERCATTDIYEKIYEVNELFKPDTFGIESSAQQSLFVDGVIMDAYMRQKTVPIVAVPMPVSISKEFRVRTVVEPVIKEGRLFINKEEHKELFNQIRDHPMNTIVDLIDALASAIHLIPKQALPREITRENQELLDYLRNTGAPIDIIQKAAQEANPDYTPPAPGDLYFRTHFGLNK